MSTPNMVPILGGETRRAGPGEGRLKEVIAKSLRRSGISRSRTADEMTRASGQRVTESMLNDWCAPSKKGLRFPAALVPALEQVTGDFELSRLLLCEEARLRLDLGAALFGTAGLRGQLRRLLAELDAAEKRATGANAKRRR
jgi:hypothetical protein